MNGDVIRVLDGVKVGEVLNLEWHVQQIGGKRYTFAYFDCDNDLQDVPYFLRTAKGQFQIELITPDPDHSQQYKSQAIPINHENI